MLYAAVARLPRPDARISQMGRMNASAAPVEASEATTRPTCYKEVWIPPNPSRLIKDKRAFIEEHRWVSCRRFIFCRHEGGCQFVIYGLPSRVHPSINAHIPSQHHVITMYASFSSINPYFLQDSGYEVRPNQNTTMITIANLFQEVASNHAVAMWGRSAEGFATDPALQKEGLIFVMTRMQIQMDRYPRWGDVVTIETWFMQAGKLGAQRDWVIRDSATGEQLGRATSTWVMINMHTRRLSKLPDFIRERFTYFQLEPPTHAIPAEKTRMKLPDVSDDTASKGPPQVARRSDVDMNGHINNVIYVAWVMETVPS